MDRRWRRIVGATRVVGAALGVCLFAFGGADAIAGAPAQGRPEPAAVERELLVPMEDLNVLLENQPRRVLLSREEYETLLKKARAEGETMPPQAAVLTDASYTARVSDGRAMIEGTLGVEALAKGVQAVPLEMGRVGLRSATLDGKLAAIGQASDGRLMLLVEGRGRHTLRLSMVAPVETTAATQVLGFRLPKAPAARFNLTVDGDIEVKGGMDVASRRFDEAARVTRFDLLPRGGDVSLVMTLNSHLLRKDQIVIARSVVAVAVGEADEQFHATVSLSILHRAVERFRFAVPEGFEITSVQSPLLSSWAVTEEDGRRVLEARLREATTDKVVLSIGAVRAGARPDDWALPRLRPLDVDGEAAVVGLFLDRRLRPTALEPKGLIAVDAGPLEAALPATMREGATLRAVAAYYAPGGQYALAGRFEKPPAKVAARGVLLLSLSDKKQSLVGSVLLAAQHEPLFEVDLHLPAAWHVERVTDGGGQPIDFERHDKADRLHVRLPRGIPSGGQGGIRFEATTAPAGWLGDWKQFDVAFPEFRVLGAARYRGAIAVTGEDDLVVHPREQVGLLPLGEAEKKDFQLAGVKTDLVYRHEDEKFKASMQVERTAPRLVARTYSFLRVEPGTLAAHYEILYDVSDARARTLRFVLPKDTPGDLAIRGLRGVGVKQYASKVTKRGRQWTVQLADPRQGTIGLAVDFQQPLGEKDPRALALPVIVAEGVAHQSGLVAVEGSAELDVRVKTDARAVDVGELVDAEYQPGRRLLGVYGFLGRPTAVTIDALRHPAYDIASAVVEAGRLVTQVSAQGIAQTDARYELRTKALYLDVELPEGATLWSVWLDGRPITPQRQDDRLLLDLAGGAAGGTRRLQLVYETPVSPVRLLGNVEMTAPRLLLRAEKESRPVEVPTVGLRWEVGLPGGWQIVRTTGTLESREVRLAEPALFVVARAFGAVALARPELGCAAKREAARAWTPAHGMPTGGGMYDMAPAAETTAAPEAAVPQFAAPAPERELANKEREVRNRRTTLKGLADELGTADGEKLQESLDFLDRNVRELSRVEGEAATAARLQDAVYNDLAKKLADLRVVAQQSAGKDQAGRTDASTAQLAQQIETLNREIEARLTHLRQAADGRVAAGTDTLWSVDPESLSRSQSAKYYGGKAGGDFGLKGYRSIKIDIPDQPAGGEGPRVVFQSWGDRPRLAMTVADGRGFNMLGWALALAVVLAGVAIGRRGRWARFRLVVGLGAMFSLLPLVPGCEALVGPCNMAFYATLLLIPYYLVVAVVRWVAAHLEPMGGGKRMRAGAAVGAIFLFLVASLGATAAEPTTIAGPVKVEMADPPAVRVPADAILVPYDSDSPDGIKNANRCFVPYEQYKELWRRANPDKALPKTPCDYALAGATYRARLVDGDDLLLEGRIEVVVHKKSGTVVPLRLAGGVLAEAKLDGEPARLSVTQAEGVSQAANPQAGPATAVLLLQVPTAGRHALEVKVRLPLRRDGGWHVASGVVPAAPASSLALTVPGAQTDVQLSETADRRSFETKTTDETIETVLGAGGAVRVQWRPKLARTEIQHSLTARSEAVLDVQEEGTRLVWNLTLEFRQDQRREFALIAPADYRIESVDGPNVRGWTTTPSDTTQRIDVTLLGPAKGSERLTLRLRRGGLPGELSVPGVRVEGAAIEQGRLAIRRSPLLEVQTAAVEGARRADFVLPTTNGHGPAGLEDPLGLRPYQAYEFAAMPFSIRLTAEPIRVAVAAEVQSILRISDDKRLLESRVNLDVRHRPIYRAAFLLPEGFELEEVHLDSDDARRAVADAGQFQWAVTGDGPRRRLTVYFAGGQSGRVAIVLNGKLGEAGDKAATRLPRLEVLDVDRQQGDIAVQVDPSFRARPEGLKHCQPVLLDRLHGWLQPAQRALVQLALHYDRADYEGRVALARRVARVSCSTITNVRVTERALEETILLDFTIREAGIRRVVFTLPYWMGDCRINAPLLREKTIEPAGREAKAPLRVALDLQDDVMADHYQVLIKNDRLPSEEIHTAPIPVVETGETARRFVVLESAGRDEVVLDEAGTTGLEAVNSRSRAFAALRQFLGDGIAQAYVVAPGAKGPQLAFAMRRRQAVVTAGASIRLAETDLRVDTAGAYRGEVVYDMDNTTEQFLSIKLPHGARLWSAVVAGDPVKPIRHPDAVDETHVCIPLVKTSAGELAYQVVLTYGGRIAPTGGWGGKVDFPLIQVVDPTGKVNLSPEVSHVRLYLPRTRRWFDFDGTMRLAKSEDQLAVERAATEAKQIRQLGQVVQTGDEYAKARAAVNLGKLALDERSASTPYSLENQQLLEQTQRQAEQVRKAPARAEAMDNRQRLDDAFGKQNVNPSRALVVEAGQNFLFSGRTTSATPSEPAKGTTHGLQINDNWFADHKAAGQQPAYAPALQMPANQPGQPAVGSTPMTPQAMHFGFERSQTAPTGGAGGMGAAGAMGGMGMGEAGLAPIAAPKSPQPAPAQQAGDKVARYQRKYEERGRGAAGYAAKPSSRPRRRVATSGEMPSSMTDATDASTEFGGVPADWSRSWGDFSDRRRRSEGRTAAPAEAPAFEASAAEAPAGMASLFVKLPPVDAEDYRAYFFTTPRGDVRITARPISAETLGRGRCALVVLIVVGLVILLARTRLVRWFGTWPGGLTLIVLGAMLTLSCLLPLVGVVLAAVGVVVLATGPNPWRAKRARV